MRKWVAKCLVIITFIALFSPCVTVKADDIQPVTSSTNLFALSAVEDEQPTLNQLEALVNNVGNWLDANSSRYSPEVISDLDAVLTVAQDVSDSNSGISGDTISPQITEVYSDLDAMWSKVKGAKDLGGILGNFVVMQYNADSTIRFNRSGYTTGSWGRYMRALSNAEGLLSNNATAITNLMKHLMVTGDGIANQSGQQTLVADASNLSSEQYSILCEVAIFDLLFSRYGLVPADLTKLIDEQYATAGRQKFKLNQGQYTSKSWGKYVTRLMEATIVEAGDGHYNNGDFRFLPVGDVVNQLTGGNAEPVDLIKAFMFNSCDVMVLTQDTDAQRSLDEILRKIKCSAAGYENTLVTESVEKLLLKIMPAQAVERFTGMYSGKVYLDTAKHNLNVAIDGLVKADSNYTVGAKKLVIHEDGKPSKTATYSEGEIVYVTNIHKNKSGTEIGEIKVGHGSGAWKGTVEMKHLKWQAI